VHVYHINAIPNAIYKHAFVCDSVTPHETRVLYIYAYTSVGDIHYNSEHEPYNMIFGMLTGVKKYNSSSPTRFESTQTMETSPNSNTHPSHADTRPFITERNMYIVKMILNIRENVCV